MAKWRIFKWLAAVGGLCVILLFAVALLLPRVRDSQAVREKIGAFLLTRLNGNVVIGNIDLKWFPRPAAVVHGVSLTSGDTVSGKIQSVEVYLSMKGLLTGNLDVSHLEMAKPALAVHLSEWAEEPFNIDEIEAKIRSLLVAFAAGMPGIVVTVKGGSAEIKIGDRPAVTFTDFEGRLRALPDNVDLQISSRANVFDSLRVEGRIFADTLVTNGRINVQNLSLRESMAAVVPRSPEYIESGNVNLNVGLTSTGLKNIKTQINGTLPSLGLVWGNRKTIIEGTSFKAVISRDDGIINAVIQQLDLVSPRLTATGELTVDSASSSVTAKLVGRDLDVSRVRASALEIAGNIEVVADIFRHVKGGQMWKISFRAPGRSC